MAKARVVVFVSALLLGSSGGGFAAEGTPVPLFEGLGELSRKVTTASPETQRYFDQGLAFLYAFNHDEAIRAFGRAGELDPKCAMAFWGVAVANGPHITLPAESCGESSFVGLMTRPPRKTQRPTRNLDQLIKRMVGRDPGLKPYAEVIGRRLALVESTEKRLTGGRIPLTDFAAGHEYFGLHLRGRQWVLREWAPNATRISLIGDASGWKEKKAFAFTRRNAEGVWELRLPQQVLKHGDLYRLKIHWRGGMGDRIPAWARRVVQDPATLIFNAQVWRPETPFVWQFPKFRRRNEAPLVYEVHPGMAQSDEKVGSWQEFSANILPRIVAAGRRKTTGFHDPGNGIRGQLTFIGCMTVLFAMDRDISRHFSDRLFKYRRQLLHDEHLFVQPDKSGEPFLVNRVRTDLHEGDIRGRTS